MDTLESVFARKNFQNLLQLLYREKTVRQKDIAAALGISKGVVCLNMNELDALGFVQQQKEGRCKTYRLLEKGAAYYETNYLPPTECEQALPAAEVTQPPDYLTGVLSQLTKSLAKLEELAKALRAQQEAGPRPPVKQGRHFETILRLLYENKTLLKNDLAARLGISPGNTFLHIKRMIEAGYVEEGRDNIRRTYRLSPAGARYYEEHHLPPGQKAKPPEPKPEKRGEKPVTVVNERNFANIMRVLYETGDIPLSGLCARLDRPHGNMYRDMQNLILEGFVKKETVKHCNYYALSDQGRQYCEQRFAE